MWVYLHVCMSPSGHEEHLIPYSLVQPVQAQTKRPVIFSPSLLSRGLIERLLQSAESGLSFNTCPPGTGHCTARTEPQTQTNSLNKKVDHPLYDYHVIQRHFLLFPVFPVVCRAHPGFRETRQGRVLVGFLQSTAGYGHTAEVNTGSH